MGLINIYDSINNEHKQINGNGYLKSLLPNYNFNNCEIIKAGVLLTGDYEVKEEDVLFLRATPRAVSTTVLAVTLTVTGVVTLAGAVVGGVLLYKQNKKTKEQMEKAQRDASNLAQQINTKPYLKGAKNSSAIGNLISYQLGKIYNTPKTLTDGFIKISGSYGSNQYFNFNFSLGYGDLQVEKVLIGDEVILENSNGIISGVHTFNSTSPYYDSENFLELRQAGEDFTSTDFNKKVVLTQDGSELKHEHEPGDDSSTEDNNGVPIIKQVADHTKKLEVCIQFNGLRKYDNNNSTWVARKAVVRPYWSNNGGATWNEFNFDGMTNNTIEINTKDTARFIATKTFTPSEVMSINPDTEEIEYKNILLKVVKTTPKMESNSNEDCYLMYYQSYCYDPKTSDLTELKDCKAIEDEFKNKIVRLAMHIKATDSTKDTLDDVHIIASAKAPIWDGVTWSETKQPTNNPAAIIYEILTSDKHKPSQMTPEEFDTEELGELYEYCDTMGYTQNAIITNAIKKLDIIDTILKNCNAIMYRQDGLIHFAIDKEENIPVALINAENIKNISYSKELKRKPDGIKVNYTNGKTWQIDTFYIMLDGRDYKTEDDIVTEISLDYVTDYRHAYKIALRNLKELLLQPRTITAGVGKVGDRYPMFSVILLQYKEFRQGLKSSTINKLITNTSGDIVGIGVSDLLKLYTDPSYKYGVIIEAVTSQGRQLIYKKITFEKDLVALGTTKGKLRTSKGLLGVKKPGVIATRKLYFDDPITTGIKPELFNIVSIGLLDEYGEFSTITNKMKITGIDPDGYAGFNLTLKDYNPSIYDVGTIPQYKSNITPPTKESKTVPSNPNANNLGEITVNIAKNKVYTETGLNKFTELDITETDETTGITYVKAGLIQTKKLIIGDSTLGEDLNLINESLDDKANAADVYDKEETHQLAYKAADESAGGAINNTLTQLFGADKVNTTTHTIIEGGTIKTGLVDADAIKATAGFFDEVTANLGTYNEITVKKAKLENTLLKLSNNYTLTITSPNDTPDPYNYTRIKEILESVRNSLYTKFGNIIGNFNGQADWIITITTAANKVINGYGSPASAIYLKVTEEQLIISFARELAFNDGNSKVGRGSLNLNYKKNDDWSITTSGIFAVNLPTDYDEQTIKNFIVTLNLSF